jgi:hypothetical protein
MPVCGAPHRAREPCAQTWLQMASPVRDSPLGTRKTFVASNPKNPGSLWSA